jgi:hypothetical protein
MLFYPALLPQGCRQTHAIDELVPVMNADDLRKGLAKVAGK